MMRVPPRIAMIAALTVGSAWRILSSAAGWPCWTWLCRGGLKGVALPSPKPDSIPALSVWRISPEVPRPCSSFGENLIAIKFGDHGGVRPAGHEWPVRFAQKPERGSRSPSARLRVCPDPNVPGLLVLPRYQSPARARWGHVHPGSWSCPQGWPFTAVRLDWKWKVVHPSAKERCCGARR